ncbi:hypothetical protein [Nitrospira lenta]|uniref:Putative site-specific recombinase transmembrane protein n=1 Tax=Nitrospira lenta TaxID=1436998 RepID=A0A330LAE2_9BACT|nr:hypothetical protein [Nitrospira lenta]SPP66681.1 putative site-specific recombinase transmembrane protein [Nitrospira lenta]
MTDQPEDVSVDFSQGNVPPAVGTVRDQVLAFFGPSRGDNATRQALAEALQNFVDASTLGDRLDTWLRLIHWTRVGTSPSLRVLQVRMRWREAYLYWELLLDVLEGVPDVRQRVQDAVWLILQETDAVNLLGEAGLPSERGLLVEVANRTLHKVLPAVRNDRDLTHLFQRQYRSTVEVKWFAQLPARLFCRILAALTPPSTPDRPNPLGRAFTDGFRLLAIRVQAQGLSDKLRARSRRPAAIMESPFYRLASVSEQLAGRWQSGEEVDSLEPVWAEAVAKCQNEIRWIRRRLEVAGVSLDIVYGLEVLTHCLKRMETMAEVMASRDEASSAKSIQAFLIALVEASLQESSVGHLLKTNTRLLHRKIVDRSGVTGEHYIAQDRREYRQIWAAAAGGGVLTSFTAAIKMSIFTLGLAPFLAGLGYGVNYAVSFLLMQTFHLILATKQPAMTAATLATIMREQPGTARLDEVVAFIKRISYSQIAAAVSNVLVVSASAYLLDACWRAVTGSPILDLHTAEHVYETLSPVNSGTVIFAALTGATLWLSSLVGGWIENWAVYHNVPQSLAEHSWGVRVFGRERMALWGDRFSRNIAGWGTNVSLGMMLGMTPAVGMFFGFPLDVRHVTLSSGMLALASASLQAEWYRDGWFLHATAGVAVMFVLNLGVSFLLSLYTALRAYDFPRRDVVELLGRLLREFVRDPLGFILPPKESEAPAGGSAITEKVVEEQP